MVCRLAMVGREAAPVGRARGSGAVRRHLARISGRRARIVRLRPAGPLRSGDAAYRSPLRDWMSATWKWEAELRGERWPGGASAAGALGALRYQALDDRVAVGGRGGLWTAARRDLDRRVSWPTGDRARRRKARSGSRVPASTPRERTRRSHCGVAPGRGRAAPALLRAHPLLARRCLSVTRSSAEWSRPAAWNGGGGAGRVFRVLRLAPAVFVDVARAWRRAGVCRSSRQADVGAGLRIAVPGAGVLRADLARGLRDGHTAVSFGWGR